MSLLKKAATALILISIFSFTSCVNVDYSLGSGFVPSDQNLQIFSDTIDLPVGLKMTDSLQASSYYLAVGNCYDEIFGLTKIDLAMTVAPPTVNDTSFKFGTDPEIISADLGFNLTNVRTFDKGELHIPQNLHIYPLTIALDTTRIFCNSIDESCYDPTPINKGSAVYFGTDSITIPLKNEWAAKFLTATDADMDSLLLYIEKFHGVYVTADDPINLDQYAGRINNFGTANMSITYKFTNSEGVRKDTTAIFPVGSGSYGFSVQRYRHESENLEMPSNNNSDILYYQGLAGIKPYIDGQELLELMHRWADKKGIDLKSLI
ncbi:MAG: DUF4270 family protein, partial [Bacteroidales bacterium]|nr:DUF4270 family protein [Bacteroidales bacterium]